MSKPGIYLDNSATTALDGTVLEAMLPYLTDHYGNAGSPHRQGRMARRAIDRAREQVAALIGAEPREIIFTASGTEANNMAVKGLGSERAGAAVCSTIEHHSVLHPVEKQANFSSATNLVPVSSKGTVSPTEARAYLEQSPRMVSVMLANNETGAIQEVKEIARAAKERGIPLHSDATQALGKIPIDVDNLGVTALTLSAHKVHGPKGVGALYLRHGEQLAPLVLGGAQENRQRAGTDNVAGIVGFGQACQLASKNVQQFASLLAPLRDRLEQELLATISDSWINAREAPRLPHLTNIGFAGVEGEAIMMALDAKGIAVGTGSACTSGSIDPSHVLLAMGQDHVRAHAGVRFSLSRHTTTTEIDQVLTELPAIVHRLRTQRP